MGVTSPELIPSIQFLHNLVKEASKTDIEEETRDCLLIGLLSILDLAQAQQDEIELLEPLRQQIAEIEQSRRMAN